MVDREAGDAESVGVKRVVDDECVTDVDFVGAQAPFGRALEEGGRPSVTRFRSGQPAVFEPLPLLSGLKRC